MKQVRHHDRVTLRAPCLTGVCVPVGTTGTVIAVLPKLPNRVKIAWDNAVVSILIVGLDDFTLVSTCLECPACENSDPFYFARDACTGIVGCDCGHEFDPDAKG